MALARSEARRSGDLLGRKAIKLGFGIRRVLLKKVVAQDDKVLLLMVGNLKKELGNGGGKVEIEE